MEKPRLGHIHFLNVLPLTYSLTQCGFDEGIDIKRGVPSVMNNDLINNRLDASEVSSIIYAKNDDKLLILPDLCVRADGPVRSIIMVSRKPIYDINEDKIILTAQSATSHTFAKIILHKAYDANPIYYTRHISPENPVPEDATAALLIGDDALNVYHHQDKEHFYYYDMGIEWKKLTGRCMVYAVWTVHKDFAEKHPDQLQLLYDRLYAAMHYGIAHKKEAINSILDTKPLTFNQLNEYLNVIKWNLTEEYLDNLSVFYKYAYEMGLITHIPRLKMAKVNI
ncbi:MAG: menaquinone biosynthesis protein [Anaerovibrio sp.]|uniref:menaquinone biosynthetic enzyme MqnA/MqnD family protein n=1 Tax=Anaerovibrio sp. TaxID=1872532 RepID=UPI0025E2886A|nr:menaquinone biosynthesis protein [Anaerovibrio sp.]MCR5177047.1 menaquinone biosynthesis protein [Anaerovibrio sp.]